MNLDQQTAHWQAIAGMVYVPRLTLSRTVRRTRYVIYDIAASQDGISELDMRQEYKRRGETIQNFSQLLSIARNIGSVYKQNDLYYANPNVEIVD